MDGRVTAKAAVLAVESLAPVPEVIDRARSGDRAAFSELYETYADQVYRYVLYRLRIPADAEDVTADVFARAFANIHRYRWQGKSFLAWLYTIARNAITDRRRRDRPTVDIDAAYGVSADGPTAHDRAVRGEALTVLKAAITRLTGEQQAVLSLRFVDDLSSAQVARRLGKKEGAIRALQFRALARLRKMLAREA
ncbi:MAG: sigma-70 family RNA polymerase sigma factor [Chloroflexi bacterium]|nr:sigma-70 family RNA polymerase sigma factor [Chloroflexota bacterium]